MVRNGACGGPGANSRWGFREFHTKFAADLLCAGAAFFEQGGIPRIAVAFTGADRKVAGGEKADTQTGRAGKSDEAQPGGQGDRSCARGVGSSARARADDARGIRAGDRTGAIRNQRWTARSSRAHHFRGKSGDSGKIAEAADAAGVNRHFFGRCAREGSLHTWSVRRGPGTIAGVLRKSRLSRGAGRRGEGSRIRGRLAALASLAAQNQEHALGGGNPHRSGEALSNRFGD